METKPGYKIRYYRKKSKMTQTELSQGIVSVSYLSKIENGYIQPPPEIIKLLNEKLKINSHAKEENNVFEICHDWFKHLLHGDKEKFSGLYEEIMNNMDNIANTPLIKLVEIHKLCYFIFMENKKKADEQFLFLEKESKKFEAKENYYWLKFSGSYKFSRLFYNHALDLYQQAEQYLHNDLYFLKEEKGDIYYSIALTACKLKKIHVAREYANKALEFYRSIYNMKKCAECHILIGISCQRANEFEKASESYRLAEIIATNLNDSQILAICRQNIGKLYSNLKNPDKAIDSYLSSYELHRNSPALKKIIPVSSLMKEYYKNKDLINAEKWLEKGLDINNQLKLSESIYVYEFEVYTHLIKGFGSSFEDLMIKKVLPFLDERELHYEKLIYSHILGDYYFNNRKYKLAAKYYNCTNKTLTNIYIG